MEGLPVRLLAGQCHFLRGAQIYKSKAGKEGGRLALSTTGKNRAAGGTSLSGRHRLTPWAAVAEGLSQELK